MENERGLAGGIDPGMIEKLKAVERHVGRVAQEACESPPVDLYEHRNKVQNMARLICEHGNLVDASQAIAALRPIALAVLGR